MLSYFSPTLSAREKTWGWREKSESEWQMERIWMGQRGNGSVKEEEAREREKREGVEWEQRETEILRTICSGLLTVLFAVKVKVSPPSFSCSHQLFFPTFFPHSPSLSPYKSSPFIFCCILLPSSLLSTLFCRCHINLIPQSHFYKQQALYLLNTFP